MVRLQASQVPSHLRRYFRVEKSRPKSLIGIPWRYALACIDQLGLILRAEIIWAKPNGLPESVTDRVRRSHEVWFHFVKSPRYFSAVDEIREANDPQWAQRRFTPSPPRAKGNRGNPDGEGGWTGVMRAEKEITGNPLGKLPGSVWRVSDGVSLVRSILDAVAAGGITPEEGERLWTGLSDSSPMLTRPMGAGTGPDTSTPVGTPRRQSATDAKTGRTESPTNSSSAPSLPGSPSTTYAATLGASDLTTSSQSLGERTSAGLIPSAPSAGTDTPWLTPTPTPPLLASPTRSAGPAPSPESDIGESVWQVPTQPLKVPPELGIDHFAAFPYEFPRRIIAGWSPTGICTVCDEGRRPVVAKDLVAVTHDKPLQHSKNYAQVHRNDRTRPDTRNSIWGSTSATITGYACACPDTTAPTRPAVVLDPFMGTGTTLVVADVMGRDSIGVDLSQDYCRLAAWRVNDPGQRAAAAQVERPDPIPPDQLDLFSDADVRGRG